MPPQQRRTPVSAVSVWTTVRDDLNRLTLELSAAVGKKISVSAVVAAMLTVTRDHRDELVAELTNPETPGGTNE